MRSLRARRHLSILAVATFASGLFVSIEACSSDVEVTTDPFGNDDAGGGTPDSSSLSEDAGEPGDDAAIDADARADAAPRTCSDDGFCHVPLPGSYVLRGVWGDGTGVVWAVSDSGDVIRWDGQSWTPFTKVKGGLYAIWGSGPTDIWIGGDGGIFHGTGPSSAQLTFTATSDAGGIPITSIHGFGPKDVWAVGGRADGEVEESQVLHYKGASSGDGPIWELDPISARVIAFSRIWGSSSNDIWLAGTTYIGDPNGAVVLHGKQGGDGATVFEEVNVNGGFRQRFLTISGGTVLSDTFVIGKFWTGLPAVWFSPAAGTDAGGPDGGPVLWDDPVFNTYYSFNAIWGSSRSDVWMSGEMGRIRHWDGATWTLPAVTITKFPFTNEIHAIWGSGKDDVWFVGDGAAVHKVAPKDGGL